MEGSPIRSKRLLSMLHMYSSRAQSFFTAKHTNEWDDSKLTTSRQRLCGFNFTQDNLALNIGSLPISKLRNCRDRWLKKGVLLQYGPMFLKNIFHCLMLGVILSDETNTLLILDSWFRVRHILSVKDLVSLVNENPRILFIQKCLFKGITLKLIIL